MTTNTPMEAALQRWCRENDIVPGVLVRAAFLGGAQAMREMCAQAAKAYEGKPCDPAQEWTAEQREFFDAGQMDASDSIEHAIRALTTDQGEKEKSDDHDN